MSFFGIGALAIGATLETAAAVAAVGIAVESTAYSAIQKNKAAHKAAGVDQATANYNANVDMAQSAQLDLDTQENIHTERQDDAVYLSRQTSGYAAAGVLATTGTALDAQILNAGRFEQHIQQQWVNLNQRQQSLASSAAVGRLEGAARASADRDQGTMALIDGGAKIASTVLGAYNSGTFS